MTKLYFVDRIGVCRAGAEVHLPLSRFDFQHPIAEGLESSAEVAATLSESFGTGLSLHGQRYLLERHAFGQGTVAVSPMVELAAELMRRWQFPGLPSRMQSFFACDTLDAARQFRLQYCQPFNRIFTVEAGECFRADMKLLHLGPTGASSFNLLQKYWRGEASSFPFWEVLLRAPLRLGEQVDPAP